MNSEFPDEPRPARATWQRVVFVVALLLVILCGLVAAAEQYFGWQPPELVRQAIKFFRNR